jgi:transcriptional regulator with XRE-family HTH domain
MTTSTSFRRPETSALGNLLRAARARRGLSQLALALESGVSQRHLSFVEIGRARPSRDLVRRLAAHFGVSLRDQNQWLLAAGYAPEFEERSLEDAALAAGRDAVMRVLEGHEPYPALAVDRHWNLLAANNAVAQVLFTGVDAALLAPPVNVVRLMLHPHGLAPRILNYSQWRTMVMRYLEQQIAARGDPVLSALHGEVAGYAIPAGSDSLAPVAEEGIFVPLQLRSDDGVLSLISTVTVFATPLEITLSELVLECFFPANAETADRLRRISAGIGGRP